MRLKNAGLKVNLRFACVRILNNPLQPPSIFHFPSSLLLIQQMAPWELLDIWSCIGIDGLLNSIYSASPPVKKLQQTEVNAKKARLQYLQATNALG